MARSQAATGATSDAPAGRSDDVAAAR